MTCIITACGWQLRGSNQLAQSINSLYVTAEDAHGPLITEIKQQLTSSGVVIAERASDAPYTLAIIEEREDKRTAGVGSDALTSAYDLMLSVDYVVSDAQGTLLTPETTATTSQTYNYSAGNASSSIQEEATLIREMHRDLAQQLLRRLQTVIARQPAPTSETPDGQTAP